MTKSVRREKCWPIRGSLEFLMLFLAVPLTVGAIIELDTCLYGVDRAKAYAYCQNQRCAWLKELSLSSWVIAPILSTFFLAIHLKISPIPKNYEELHRFAARMIDATLLFIPLLSTIYMVLTDEALGLHKSMEFYLIVWSMNVLLTYISVQMSIMWYCEFMWPRLLERQQEGLKRN